MKKNTATKNCLNALLLAIAALAIGCAAATTKGDAAPDSVRPDNAGPDNAGPDNAGSKYAASEKTASEDARPAHADALNWDDLDANQALALRPEGLPAPRDVSQPPANAEVTASGLASRVLRAGSGAAHPGPTSRVTVHYIGWTTDGKMFDASFKRGQTATFPLNAVIAGWTEGLQLMVEGERRRIWIPQALAYKGRPGRPRGMLVFDVALLTIER